jgi:hypothetical protein
MLPQENRARDKRGFEARRASLIASARSMWALGLLGKRVADAIVRQGAQANPIPRLLLDYDAGPRHDLAERRDLVLHEAGEFGGRAADHIEPEIDHPATHPRHADDLD